MPPNQFGGRRSGPPSLDDIPWDQISRRVPLVLSFVVVMVVLLFATTMFYRVDASDAGVGLLFGKYEETVSPGLHWKLPWPVESVYQVPVQRIQSLEFGFKTDEPGRVTQYRPQTNESLAVSEMLTGDLNLGHVEWIVQYRVKDPLQYLFKMGSSGNDGWAGSSAEVNPAVPDTIRDVSESVMRKLVGDSSIDYGLTIGRDQLAKQGEILIQQELDAFEAGVDIVTVKLQTTSPPTKTVQDAFQEVNRARQKKEQVVNEAQGERNSKIPAARGARDQAIAEAEGYQNRIVLETEGKTSAFLAQLKEYEAAKDVTRKRLYLETMEEILSTVGKKTIIDDSIQGVLPLLNLDDGSTIPGSEKGGQR